MHHFGCQVMADVGRVSIQPYFDVDEFFADPMQSTRWIRVATYGEMGSEAEVYLVRLFDIVRSQFSGLDHGDVNTAKLVAYGSRSMGQIVGSIGYRESDSQHRDILTWLVALTKEDEPHIAEMAVWGLGDIGVPPETVRSKLKQLATGGVRLREPKHATIRSVAFRMLARVARSDAKDIVDSEACSEYLASVETWLRELEDNGRKGNESYWLHIEESAWLRDPKNRVRTAISDSPPHTT